MLSESTSFTILMPVGKRLPFDLNSDDRKRHALGGCDEDSAQSWQVLEPKVPASDSEMNIVMGD
jgi:hypothetical protein